MLEHMRYQAKIELTTLVITKYLTVYELIIWKALTELSFDL